MQEDAYEKINRRTTTLYANNPSLILPTDFKGNYQMLEQNNDNQYLHILLPANQLNILNAPNASNGIAPTSSENMMIEIGCKIFEVNHVGGLNTASDASSEFIEMWSIAEEIKHWTK